MVDVETLKQLRERTDASISACKNALEKANGDINQAVVFLKEEGSRVAEKKASRETGIGIIEAYVHSTQKVGTILEIRSETDFVARNPDFKALAHDIAMHIAAADPADVPALLAQPFIKDEKRTVGDLVTEAIARFGENIQVSRFSRFQI